VHSVFGIGAALLVSALYGLLIAIMNSRPLLQGMIANTVGPFAVGRHVQNLVIYGLLVGSMTVIRTQRQRRGQEQESAKLAVRASQLEARLATAQLSFLRMQLHPHFLFNALNSITSLVQQKRIDEASRTIDLLAGLLRAALDHSTSPFVTLEREIDFLKRYMEIERVRYPGRFEPEFQVESGCERARVPALILQPLVENAIGHALALHVDARMLKVVARTRGDCLQLEVHDNGPGFPADWNFDRDAGIGLGNIQERLRIHYGESGELYILSRPDGEGSIVGIRIPSTQADAT
jgi:two-component system LytT family sensor kinase